MAGLLPVCVVCVCVCVCACACVCVFCYSRAAVAWVTLAPQKLAHGGKVGSLVMFTQTANAVHTVFMTETEIGHMASGFFLPIQGRVGGKLAAATTTTTTKNRYLAVLTLWLKPKPLSGNDKLYWRTDKNVVNRRRTNNKTKVVNLKPPAKGRPVDKPSSLS